MWGDGEAGVRGSCGCRYLFLFRFAGRSFRLLRVCGAVCCQGCLVHSVEMPAGYGGQAYAGLVWRAAMLFLPGQRGSGKPGPLDLRGPGRKPAGLFRVCLAGWICAGFCGDVVAEGIFRETLARGNCSGPFFWPGMTVRCIHSVQCGGPGVSGGSFCGFVLSYRASGEGKWGTSGLTGAVLLCAIADG